MKKIKLYFAFVIYCILLILLITISSPVILFRTFYKWVKFYKDQPFNEGLK